MPLRRLQSGLVRSFVRAVSHPRLSRATARLADLRFPGPLLRLAIGAYVRAYRVDLGEAAEPPAGYPTFNAFFTRRLREGLRPIDPRPRVVVSAADARLQSIGPLPEDGRLEQIKGRTYGLAALLGAEEDAEPFRRGHHATLYLSPSMYHRVHSPVDGRIVAWRYVPGRLYPVNALAVRHVEGLFTVNERVSVLIDSDEMGRVAVVLVGATNVGRITLTFTEAATNTGQPPAHTRPPVPIAIRRGQELGTFNLGSTVVLLVAEPALRPAGVVPGEVVRVGQALWAKA